MGVTKASRPGRGALVVVTKVSRPRREGIVVVTKASRPGREAFVRGIILPFLEFWRVFCLQKLQNIGFEAFFIGYYSKIMGLNFGFVRNISCVVLEVIEYRF